MASPKRIADPIYGTIQLNEIESEIIDTAVFQRLHNIRHLGLAHLVFPTAGYSRFSHSIGVCHTTKLLLETLCRLKKVEISDAEIQLYRLAALLHDIGHYPFSHVMEQAIKNHYSSLMIKNISSHARVSKVEERFFNHERVGKEVLLRDAELKKIFSKYSIDPRDAYSIFMREAPPRFTNLVSSDLDADRIDYLLRTSHHTGLPYGFIDYHYFLSQMRLDRKNRVCLTSKAMHTAEHFLLGRYFDYLQVTFHKTIAALELVLKDVIEALLQNGNVNCSASWVANAIKSRKWGDFDDSCILKEILKMSKETSTNPIVRQKANAILRRTPPKLICESEYIDHADRLEEFLTKKQALNEKIAKCAKHFKIDRSLWYVWEKSGITLTKIGSHIPISAIENTGATGKDKDRYEQAVRVLDSKGESSKSIVELKNSLMNVLSDYALFAIRIYVLFPKGTEHKRGEITDYIKRELPHLAWK